ncbi:hypothetical protein HMPREF9120_00480 [Neisseria sp. oral taxon 020 str. F0370]|nr:hypothetical protein HMPREF9120_00480 [Neisseria sp. oral taxon 020 str. F0370]
MLRLSKCLAAAGFRLPCFEGRLKKGFGGVGVDGCCFVDRILVSDVFSNTCRLAVVGFENPTYGLSDGLIH